MTANLKREIDEKIALKRTNIRNLLMYNGYKHAYTEKPISAKAEASAALFRGCEKHINKNDLILGSFSCLFTDKDIDIDELKLADKICDSYGFNTFITNADHFTPDYAGLLKEGICGILERIERSIAKYSGDNNKTLFLSSMKKTVLAQRDFILGYADTAEKLSDAEGYNASNLKQAAADLRHIAYKPPQTFRQALQLVYITHLLLTFEGRYAMALGSMDRYLFKFYKKDAENQVIDSKTALALLENVFIKIDEYRLIGGSDVVNICIGGYTDEGTDGVNELSYIILDAVKNCAVAGPNLSARITSKTPDKFLDACLKVIGTGIGYPALFNDEINIPALLSAGYKKEDVYNYTMVGCIENFITGMQPPWSDGRFDTPVFMEYVLNNSKGISSGDIGAKAKPLWEINNMQDFLFEFKKQLELGAQRYYATFNNENTRYNKENYAQPFLSCFCRDCIDRGLDINGGGAIYPSVHGVGCMGIGTVADSLAAIEKVVFADKKATLQDVCNALKNDFLGFENLQELLAAAPKYGNNDDFADKYAVWFIDTLHEIFSRFRTYDNGLFYIAAAANTANIYAGKDIAATADGRRAGQPLSDAASPTYGKDVRGATATANSIVKPDYTKVLCGSVVNQKFSPVMFSDDDKRGKLLKLIKTYFSKGGQQMQINATSRELLMDAIANPEKHRNLIVRVSGFSAYFITLDNSVKQDILMRTQQR